MNDYNLQYIKLTLLLLSFSLYFTINGFFFSDETMHTIYNDNGAFNYLYQMAEIVYSSLIPSIINIILKLLALSENEILKIKKLPKSKSFLLERVKHVKNSMQIRFSIFYILSYILIFFFWYFISCFCGVYKNTQNILIKDSFISFGLSMIYPFIIYLLPGIFRIPALRAKNKDRKMMYKISKLIALI